MASATSPLASENVTVKQLYDTIAELAGLRAARLRAPMPVVRAIATLARAGG